MRLVQCEVIYPKADVLEGIVPFLLGEGSFKFDNRMIGRGNIQILGNANVKSLKIVSARLFTSSYRFLRCICLDERKIETPA